MSLSDYKRLLEACRSKRQDFIEKLKEYVLIETPSGNPEQNRKLLDMIAGDFEDLGCSTELKTTENSGGILTARAAGYSNERKQLMVGHSDTVWPVGTLQKMPWIVDEDEGVTRGPGVYDMKSGIVMMQMALSVMKELDLKPTLQPVVMINTDEEIGSPESKDEFLNIAREMDRVFVPEPSLGIEGLLKTSRKGSARYTITVHGIAAHAGIEPEKGVSAIVEMAYVVQRLNELNDADRGVSVNIGTISGGQATNVIPDHAEISVGVRMLRVDDAEGVDEQIRSMQPELEGAEIEVEGGLRRPPMEQNERNRELWDRAKRCADELGIELDHGLSGGGSDGSFTSLHAATLDGMGPVGDGAHKKSEMLVIDKTIERIALLAAMLMEE